ncbi:interferon-stimulated 20 kDa exonuclease-like 2 [Syngnathoides biaculeatus]|uniref:interferon-stimulated 20 kDa exonuclease-like 2 n=1 Tax=Syngnathoides biaculeatus TaxID=300417 RepID=UPI002ADD9B51|nr:interferon-stimulated 20 kDa exonuclease-like 2 [Syngnathoides biaculeatus]XP_061677160.1 interferon-stimulated 20 kDa exonuclease-like 2 [Syngnathoides biaculeatus]XP_061677161.1 interferon-stimulated 20 kDa exonuclease-like 2 [Syngnathoides biaculeatus]
MSDLMLNVRLSGDYSSGAVTPNRMLLYKTQQHNVAHKLKKRKRKRKKFTPTSEQSVTSAQPPSCDISTPNQVLPHSEIADTTSSSSRQQPSLTASNADTKALKPNSKSIPIATCHLSALPSKYLAMDCEMVGTGPKGSISQLGRCSIVSYEGDVVYDKFIKPSVPVTNYRTPWSGIRACDLRKATPYCQARKEILKLLAGKVVIGHAVHNDFQVLQYSHPAALTRDTSRIPLLNRRAGFEEKGCASLKRLTKAIFNRDIQTGRGGHSSVEDARATMELYKLVEDEWEKTLASRKPVGSRGSSLFAHSTGSTHSVPAIATSAGSNEGDQ